MKHRAEYQAHKKHPTNTHEKWGSVVLKIQADMCRNASSATYIVCNIGKIISAFEIKFL